MRLVNLKKDANSAASLSCSLHSWEFKPTHQEATSNESPHVLHLLSDVSVFDILHVPTRKEQDDVTGDGQKHEWVKRDCDKAGAFSCTHVEWESSENQTNAASLRFRNFEFKSFLFLQRRSHTQTKPSVKIVLANHDGELLEEVQLKRYIYFVAHCFVQIARHISTWLETTMDTLLKTRFFNVACNKRALPLIPFHLME